MRRPNVKFWFSLIAFVALLTHIGAQANAANHGGKDLTGTWLSVITPDPSDPNAPPPFSSLITFTADGNFVTTETDEQAIGQGVWANSGYNQFSLTGYQFEFDTPNVWGGTFKLRARLTVDSSALHFNGPFQVDFYDTSGNALFSGVGSLAGTRIEVEPLP